MSRACFAQELNTGFFCYTEGHEYFAEVWSGSGASRAYGVFGSVYLVSDWFCNLPIDFVVDFVVYLIGNFPLVEESVADLIPDLVIYVHRLYLSLVGYWTWS